LATISYDQPPVVLTALLARSVGSFCRIGPTAYIVANRDAVADEVTLLDVGTGASVTLPGSSTCETIALASAAFTVG
tara:strand:+ start:6243 stop:6473 length:231 start_codon:yes stop_codon:yes gene_type:complete